MGIKSIYTENQDKLSGYLNNNVVLENNGYTENHCMSLKDLLCYFYEWLGDPDWCVSCCFQCKYMQMKPEERKIFFLMVFTLLVRIFRYNLPLLLVLILFFFFVFLLFYFTWTLFFFFSYFHYSVGFSYFFWIYNCGVYVCVYELVYTFVLL